MVNAFIRKTIPLTLGLLLIAFTGCTSKGTVEYNNLIVETLNQTSDAMVETTLAYDENVPNTVMEDSVIESESMEASYQGANEQLEETQKLLNLRSRNTEQQEAVQMELKTYITHAQDYLNTYNEMLLYYKEESFRNNLEKVAEYDEQLHQKYNEFIQSNNTLVDILGEFI